MAEPDAVGTPGWWLEQLYRRLVQRASSISRLEAYYDGDHPLSFATSKYRAEFSQMLRAVRDNWMALVVDAVEERLHVEGFRLGEDPAADDDAWGYWQRNGLDADSELAHTTSLTTGNAAVMVWGDEDGARPVITIEHPAQVYVAYEPGSRRERRAALKAWRDEWTGHAFANLYLPDRVIKFQGDVPVGVDATGIDPNIAAQILNGVRWTLRGDDAEMANPLGVVPIVELINRPRMLGGTGRSEIAEVTTTQDQINKLVCDMMIASEFGAFRQRWATGVEAEVDDDGQEVDAFVASISRLWAVGAPDAKFGDFPASDLSNFIGALENRVQSLASRTRTPPHYLLGGMAQFPSGESLRAAETGLIAKVRNRQRRFGEGWEEVIRLAFAVTDDPRKDAHRAETIWADPESRTESEHVDALVKKLALGVPLAQLWEDAGYSQTEISRFRLMLAEQAVYQAVTSPAPAGPPPVDQSPFALP